jgi:hypothetical protein
MGGRCLRTRNEPRGSGTILMSHPLALQTFEDWIANKRKQPAFFVSFGNSSRRFEAEPLETASKRDGRLIRLKIPGLSPGIVRMGRRINVTLASGVKM